MKETQFVDQNKAKWLEFEKELKQSEPKPYKVSHFYVETIDDLSFARTHYPNRLVRSYLNGLAESLSLKVQKSQKNYLKNFGVFWQRDFPLMMYEARNQFLLSFLILVLSICIGIFSSMHDSTFANYILGDDYIETTLQNIAKGDPMAIYKADGQTSMFLGITLNNILVSVRTFLLSLFAGAGTLMVIIYNGVMLGVFQYFFIERGLFFESFLTIWQHGVIEISCIVLAGAAGLVLAKGILFPGTLSRLDAFRIAGKKGLIIMLGLMPLLIYSGAIEAFVTRHTDIHWSIRLLSILITLSFVLVYFVWYPRRVAQNEKVELTFKTYMHPILPSSFSFTKIQKNPKLIWESVRMLKLNSRLVIKVIGTLVLMLITILSIAINTDSSFYLYQTNMVGIAMLFNYSSNSIFLIHFFTLLTGILLSQNLTATHAANALNVRSKWKNKRLKLILFSLLISVALSFVYRYGWTLPIVLILLPAVGFFFTITSHRNEKMSTSQFLKWLFSSYGKMLLLVVIVSAVFLVASLCIQFSFGELFPSISPYFIADQATIAFVNYGASYLAISLLLSGFYYILFSAIGLNFYSVKEVQTAQNLKQRIADSFPRRDQNFTDQNPNLLSSQKLNHL